MRCLGWISQMKTNTCRHLKNEKYLKTVHLCHPCTRCAQTRAYAKYTAGKHSEMIILLCVQSLYSVPLVRSKHLIIIVIKGALHNIPIIVSSRGQLLVCQRRNGRTGKLKRILAATRLRGLSAIQASLCFQNVKLSIKLRARGCARLVW